MKKFFILLTSMLLPFSLLAQNSISGTVTNKTTGEALAGATVLLPDAGRATATRPDGSFSFSRLKAGSYTIQVTYVGFEPWQQDLQLQGDQSLEIKLTESAILTDEVIVSATRATEKTPTTFTRLDRQEIEKQNFGQDIPYLLNLTPSVVTTSDAGAGIGYTGVRIRGSDATRINVTINGIPLNDSESHGVYWVNMPDFASSVENIQIQRGVGTSTNGAAAFGATINVQTSTLNREPYAEADNTYGSFNTWKHTVKAGTGLIREKFAFDARLSKISSDGYIDRAFSDLKSFYVSGGYYSNNTLIKANIFSGKEQTYQSWYGTPQNKLETDRTYNYYTYDNETDNYQQDHYQFIVAHDLLPNLTLNGALHYTRGRGYYEQFRSEDDFAGYPVFGIDSLVTDKDTIYTTDLIRRRWLDNHFYGATWSANYQAGSKLQFVFGGGSNKYTGDHFGEVVWARFAGNSNIRDRYYDNTAEKKDLNLYLKTYYQVNEALNLFLDLQGRFIDYEYFGVDNDLRDIKGTHSFNFFNPKAGFSYSTTKRDRFYASYAKGSREPVRSDFIDAPEGKVPKAEILHNYEAGYEKKANNYSFTVNYYLMDYTNQLVLTGELNDVGSPIRTNVSQSYRTGIELQAGYRPTNWLEIIANATFSQNKIQNFTEVLYMYDENWSFTEIAYNEYRKTDIAYSPSVITGGIVNVRPVNWLEVSILPKYVGEQYLDNTQSQSRKIEGYFVNDLRIRTSFRPKYLKELNLALQINNLFNHLYESNGYTYGYGLGDEVIYENFYYPQAGTNFLFNMNLKF